MFYFGNNLLYNIRVVNNYYDRKENKMNDLENIPYPKGLFRDGRVSDWYINPNTLRLYRKKGDIYETITYPIPQFVAGERLNRKNKL
jgi:hypothetical protein